MKNKIFIAAALTSLCVAGVLWAADSLGGYSDAVKQVNGSRWQLYRSSSTVITNVATMNTTNIILTTAGIVSKVIWVPDVVGDQFEIHTASTAAQIATANEIFVVNSTSNSTTGPVTDYPQIFDLSVAGGGLDATNGIAIVVKPANTSSVSRVFILYDRNR